MYRVLIIGAGKIGAMFDKPGDKKILTHAHGFSESPYFELTGFYDVNSQKAEEAARRWGVVAFPTLETAMKDIDVVCCCVPDEYHYATLKQIRQFPVKLVVTEKPLARTSEEAAQIQEMYQNLPCLVNYSRRFLKEFQELKEEIPAFGKFLRGTGYYGKGILHNGSHMIDLLCYLLGSIEKIESSNHAIHDFFEEDPSCDVELLIGGGRFMMNAIDCSVATIFELDLFFSKARIRILESGVRIEKYRVQESDTYAGYYNYVLQEEKLVDYSNAIVGLVENVRQHLEQKKPLNCGLEEGRAVLDCCLKIRGEVADANMYEALLEIMAPEILEKMKQTEEHGIQCLVDTLRDFGHSDEEIKSAVIKKYHLLEDEIKEYL